MSSISKDELNKCMEQLHQLVKQHQRRSKIENVLASDQEQEAEKQRMLAYSIDIETEVPYAIPERKNQIRSK